MKPVFSLVLGLFLAVIVSPLYADDPGETVSEPGLFSYVAPAGWGIESVSVSKYKVAKAPAKDGFAPNINVVRQDYAGTLQAYVDANIDALKKAPIFSNVVIVGQSSFTGADGVKGIRLETTDTLGKADLRQFFYFFESGKSKLVVTATCQIGTGAEYGPVFDASMRTFSVH